jgi:hypothetical protein
VSPLPPPDSAGLRRALLAVVLLAGSFQAGRLAERAVWPCRLRPLAPLLRPLLGRELPSEELCELLERIPRL